MPDNSTDPKPTPFAFGFLGQALRAVGRQAAAVLGLVLIVLSIPIAIMTPVIPVGLPLGIFGVMLLGRNSTWGRRLMEGVLAKHPRVERFAPNWLMKAVFGRDKRSDAETAE